MLSISLFLVIDDNSIKAYKKIFNKTFEFSDLVEAPSQYVHMNGIQHKLASHAKLHILIINETPLNLSIRGVQQVCVNIINKLVMQYVN